MSKEPLYWITKDGRKINVDDMSDNHVRNAFKMILRKLKSIENDIKRIDELNKLAVNKNEFKIKGDMANEFNDSFPDDEDYCDATEIDIY